MQSNLSRHRTPGSFSTPTTSSSGGAGRPASILSHDEEPSPPTAEASSKTPPNPLWFVAATAAVPLLYFGTPYAAEFLFNGYLVFLRSDVVRLLFWSIVAGGISLSDYSLGQESKENVPITNNDRQLVYEAKALLCLTLARTVTRYYALQTLGCQDLDTSKAYSRSASICISLAWTIWSAMLALFLIYVLESSARPSAEYLAYLVLALPNLVISGWRASLLAIAVFVLLSEMSPPKPGTSPRTYAYHLARLNCRVAALCFLVDLFFGCTSPQSAEAWISQALPTILFVLLCAGLDFKLVDVAKRHGFPFG